MAKDIANQLPASGKNGGSRSSASPATEKKASGAKTQ